MASAKSFPSELTDQFKFAETIGEGGFAKVRVARHKLTNEKVAIKIMDKAKLAKTNDLPRVKLEIEALKDLHHHGIAQLYLFHETPTQFYLILEHAPGGELFDYIVSQQRCKEDVARRFFRQIIAGVAHCHERGIAHRDLKPENLLLDKQMNIKLIDFGLIARPGDIKTDLLKTCCGSAAYAAPELIRGEKYLGEAADMWSLGILLYALLVGWLPFDDDNMQTLYKLIQKGSYEIPAFLSNESVKLIGALLKHKPQQRLTMEQLLSHSWVVKGTGSSKIDPASTLGDKQKLDKTVVTELAKYYAQDAASVEALILQWKYDSLTANYHLLCQKKRQGGPIKLRAGGAAMPPDMARNAQELLESRKGAVGGATETVVPIADFSAGHMAQRLISGGGGKRSSPEGVRAGELPPISAPLSEVHRSASLGASPHDDLTQVGRSFGDLSIAKGKSGGGGGAGTVGAAAGARLAEASRQYAGSAAAGINRVGVETTQKKKGSFRHILGSVASWIGGGSRDGLNGPRKIKGLFNVSTTSGKEPDEVLAEVQRVLEASAYDVRVKGYLIKARREMANGKQMSINFEVCVTANLDLTGIRLTRVKGESFEYKQAVTELLGQMRL